MKKRNQNALPFSVVNYRGGLAMAYQDSEGVRRKRALKATEANAAIVEADRLYNAMVQQTLAARTWTVGEIWEAYLQYLGDRPSAARAKSETRSILPAFGHLHPSELTEGVVKNYIATRRNLVTGAPIHPGTLWTELGRLRDAINYAVKRGWLDRSQVVHISRPQKPDPKTDFLDDEQIGRLLKASKHLPHLHLAIHLMLATGGRVTAVLQMTWDRVDLVRGTIDLRLDDMRGLKNRAVVPMNDTIKRLLLEAMQRNESDSGYVIKWRGQPVVSIKTAFKAAARRAGLSNVSPHVLRHTAAVRMAAAGSPMTKIAAILGHKDSRITETVYANFSPNHLKAEVRALELPDDM